MRIVSLRQKVARQKEFILQHALKASCALEATRFSMENLAFVGKMRYT
jgi:hypothetical protein